MRVDQAESRLLQMLTDAGIEIGVASPAAARTAWDTFKAFAAEPADVAATDPDRDMVLMETGLAEWEGSNGFEVILVRQFVVHDASDEYDHMEQLHCHLYSDLTPEVEGLEEYEFHPFLPPATHLDEWVRDVEDSAWFVAVIAAPASRVFVAQERV